MLTKQELQGIKELRAACDRILWRAKPTWRKWAEVVLPLAWVALWVWYLITH